MPDTRVATIANGESLSSAVDLQDGRAARIDMPSAWTAADLTFQVSPDGNTYTDLYEADGTEYTVTAAASRSIILPIADFLGIRYLKVRSGTSAAAVNQGAARNLTIQAVPA
jgi:hypothetical protein